MRRNDWPLAQAACRELEDRHDLVRVGCRLAEQPDLAINNETSKATGPGKTAPAREVLRRRVRDAATTAVDTGDLFRRLTADCAVTVTMRPSTGTRVRSRATPSSVAGNTTAAGDPVIYRGSKLAADLSLVRSRQRWQPETTQAGRDRRARHFRPPPAEVYHQASALITTAAHQIRTHADQPAIPTPLLRAASDLFTVTVAA